MSEFRPRGHLRQNLPPGLLVRRTTLYQRRIAGLQLRCQLVDNLFVPVVRDMSA
jgi:hypothetical protein